MVVASLAASTLASHRRQLGGHALALSLDGLAVRKASRRSPGAGTAMGILTAWMSTARSWTAWWGWRRTIWGSASWPPRRSCWRGPLGRCGGRVLARRGPIGLGARRAGARLRWACRQVSPAKRAREVARERGSVRHVVKSELILGAALGAMGEQENGKQATKLVTNALTTARRYGWRSLIWPAQLLLFDLDVSLADWKGSKVTNELKELLGFADPVGSRLAQASPVGADLAFFLGDRGRADIWAKVPPKNRNRIVSR